MMSCREPMEVIPCTLKALGAPYEVAFIGGYMRAVIDVERHHSIKTSRR
jgi:hypothetical protein